MTVARLDDLRARNAGYRLRSVDELHADITAGCRTLGQLADEWSATGHILVADLTAVDRTIAGLRSLLIALHSQGGCDAG